MQPVDLKLQDFDFCIGGGKELKNQYLPFLPSSVGCTAFFFPVVCTHSLSTNSLNYDKSQDDILQNENCASSVVT